MKACISYPRQKSTIVKIAPNELVIYNSLMVMVNHCLWSYGTVSKFKSSVSKYLYNLLILNSLFFPLLALIMQASGEEWNRS